MYKLVVSLIVFLSAFVVPAAASALNFQSAAGSPLFVYPPNDVITDVTTGNFNGDIYDDVAAVGQGNKIYVWFTQADGTFQAAPGSPFGTDTTDTTERYKIWSKDLNNDFSEDLVIQTGQFPGTFHTYFNNGNGTFPATPNGSWEIDHTGPPEYRGAAFADSASFGDLNGDGCPDLLVGMFERSYQIGISNCAGSFTRATAAPVQLSTPLSGTFDGFTSTAIGDYNGDGDADIALMLRAIDNSGDGQLIYVADGLGSGSFATPQVRSSPGNPPGGTLKQIETADINGDSFDDLAFLQVKPDSTEAIVTMVGSATGLFPNPNPGRALEESFRGIGTFGTGDIDDDGDQDIAVTFWGNHEFSFGLGDGDGGFAWNPISWTLPPLGANDFFPNNFELPDLNGDGFLDFVSSSSHSGYPNQARGIRAFISRPDVSADRSSISFPETAVGQESPAQTVTLSVGAGPSASFDNFDFSITGVGDANFDLDTDCPGTVTGGDTCEVNVTYAPSVDGLHEPNLKITTPDGNTIIVSLSGVTGHEEFKVNSPDGRNFEFPGGAQGTQRTFEIESTGTWPVKVTDIHVYSDFEEDQDRWSIIDMNNCETTLQPDQKCEFDVFFNPSLDDTGRTLDAFVVLESDNEELSGLYAELTGKATNSAFEVTPNALEFGERTVGTGPSAVKQFTIETTGDGPTPFYGFEWGGDDKSSFAVAGDGNCPDLIPTDSSCTFSVTFDPKGELGLKQAQAKVFAYNNNGSEFSVNLNGTAVSAEPPPGPEAKLRFKVKSAKKAKAGKKLLVTATVRNVGNAASFPVVVKATSPKRLARPVKAQKIKMVRIGETVTRKFRIPVKKNAKGKFKVKVTMTHNGLSSTKLGASTPAIKVVKRKKR